MLQGGLTGDLQPDIGKCKIELSVIPFIILLMYLSHHPILYPSRLYILLYAEQEWSYSSTCSIDGIYENSQHVKLSVMGVLIYVYLKRNRGVRR